MLQEVNRTSSSWEHAAYLLSKNDATIGRNVNELTERFDNFEKRFNRVKKHGGRALLCLGALAFIQFVRTEGINERLEKCEQKLKEKEDRVIYNDRK